MKASRDGDSPEENNKDSKEVESTLNGPLRLFLFSISFVVGILLPAILTLFSYNGIWVLVLAGTVGMLLTRLEDIESFTLGPLKANLKRQAQYAAEAAAQANATVQQLRQISVALARQAFNSQPMVTWRFGPTVPLEYRIEERDRIIKALRAVKVTTKEINELVAPFNQGALADLVDLLQEEVTGFGKEAVQSQETMNKYNEFRELLKEERLKFVRGEIEYKAFKTAALNSEIVGIEKAFTKIDSVYERLSKMP